MSAVERDSLIVGTDIDNIIKKLIKDASQEKLLNVQLAAIKAIYIIAVSPDESLIDKLIVYGALPAIFNCAKQKLSVRIQNLAVSVINNIITGREDQLNAVVKSGGLSVLRNSLNSTCIEVCHQAATAFTNIVVVNQVYCGQVINVGIVRALTSLYARFPKSPCICRPVACILRYVCKTSLCITSVKQIVLILRSLIILPDAEVKLDVLYAIAYLTDIESYQSKKHIKSIIDTGLVEYVTPFLADSNVKVLVVALRAVGNILSSSNALKQSVLDGDLLEYLVHLVMHSDTLIQKASLYCLKGIMEKKGKQVQAVIDAGLFTKIINNLNNEDLEIKVETTWTVFYLTAVGSRDQILTLIEEGCIPYLCSMLDCTNSYLLKIVLLSISYLLDHSEELISIIASMINMCNITKILESLMDHEDAEIKTLSNDIFMQITYAASEE